MFKKIQKKGSARVRDEDEAMAPTTSNEDQVMGTVSGEG
jgi:hypothetical protein